MGCAIDTWSRDGEAPRGVGIGAGSALGCDQRSKGAQGLSPKGWCEADTTPDHLYPAWGCGCSAKTTEWGCAVETALCWPREWGWGNPAGSHPSLPIPRPALPLSPGSGRAGEPFPEAVYEEIAYSLAWKKQPRFSLSDVLPGGEPADGYDDAGEVSDPGEDPVPGYRDWEVPRTAEEGDGPRDAATGGSLHTRRSAGHPGAEGDTSSPFLGTMGYDDAEEVSLACPHEDSHHVTPEPFAQGSHSPRPAEPSPAEQLGAAAREKSSVPLGEP
ncbi:uncharacterized protein LOC118159500 [Oxyura jamaicensis]|uniref:uncharacterized protein LOC118159500 n=1 Tax=Oxyura jamaicensis TaxID=8884 RepID=UPI0015A6C49D|nr:uncharacterized protein LOC118159500 [Oxyura jamaicensis]